MRDLPYTGTAEARKDSLQYILYKCQGAGVYSMHISATVHVSLWKCTNWFYKK